MRVTSNVLGCRCVGLECKFPKPPSHIDKVGAAMIVDVDR